MTHEKTLNLVLFVLMLATVFYAGFNYGERREQKRILTDCENEEFTQIYDKQISCSIRTMIR